MRLPYGRQSIDQDDIAAVVEALQSDYLTTGPLVDQFEYSLCEVTKAKFAVACSNGTTALHLACLALDLKEGDHVIVPTITFLATANAARYCGADVLFCDVDPDTGLMTPEGLKTALEHADNNGLRVKVVFPVHLAGRPVDLLEIRKIAEPRGIKIIADSCHAIGGYCNDAAVGAGSFEDMATFSFHPVKTITTGEGGAVTTNSEELAIRMRRFRHHSMVKSPQMHSWEYEMHELGHNHRISDIQCALGLSQLNRLSEFVSQRRDLVALYNAEFNDISSHINSHEKSLSDKVSWHLYSARIDFEKLGISRQSMMEKLRDKGVGTQVHYIPVHTQPYYKRLYGDISLPGAKQYYERTLSFPLYPRLSKLDVDHVVSSVREIALGG